MEIQNAPRNDGAKMVGMIDLTPTWRSLMPVLLAAVQDGTDIGRKMAAEELYRLADFADAANAEVR